MASGRQLVGDIASLINQTRARHILITPNEIRTEEQAKALIDSLYVRINGGEDFAQIARELSDDSASVVAGGDMGWANSGAMVPEFEKDRDVLQLGEISDPLVTRFGVHLVQVLERREEPLTIRDKQDMARNILRERKFDDTMKNWEREIRGRAYVEYRDPPQ